MDEQFAALEKLLGTPVEKEDIANVDQCMDFAFAWVDILGIDRITIRHQYAYQAWTLPNDETVAHFLFIPNTPNGIPQKGDLPIFEKEIPGITGIAGHICVATGEGDTNTFHSLDQNWNGVPHVTKENHTYTGVLGWLRPKMGGVFLDSQTFSTMRSKCDRYDEFAKIGYTTASDVSTTLQALQSQIDTTSKSVGQLTKDSQNLTLALSESKSTNSRLADEISQLEKADATAIDAGITATADLKTLHQDIADLASEVLQTTYPPLSNLTDRIHALQNQVKLYALEKQQTTQHITSVFQQFINIVIGWKKGR